MISASTGLGTARSSRRLSTLDGLAADLRHLLAGRRVAHHPLHSPGTVLHPELELVLREECVELLGADRSDRNQLVGLRVVVERDRGERLRRRARNDARAGRRIVDAVLGAAVDHATLAGWRRLLLEADEADLTGGIGKLVRADRRVGDDLPIGADAALPCVARAVCCD